MFVFATSFQIICFAFIGTFIIWMISMQSVHYFSAALSLQLFNLLNLMWTGESGLIRPHDDLPLLQNPIFMHNSKLKLCFSQLASLISGFLMATQLFIYNRLRPLYIVCGKILLLSQSNIVVSATVVSLKFYFTKRLSDYHFWDFFPTTVLPRRCLCSSCPSRF